MSRLFVLLLLVISTSVHCQNKFGNEWNIGLYGYQVKFDNLNLIHDTTYINHQFSGGKSNICDSNGNMLLCSNGFEIYDSTGNVIDEGDSLVPIDYYNYFSCSLSSQSSIFLPVENRKYYFVTPVPNDTMFANWFTNSIKAPFNLLLYNVIDMNANGGLGKVTKRMIPIIENKELNKTNMMACRHANGKDWWLLKMAGDSNMVYTFLFTQDSVYDKGLQVIPFPFRGYLDLDGQMVFSQDGKKWASTYSSPFAEVYYGDFDRCTGQLSNLQKVAVPPQSTGLPQGFNQADTANLGLCFSPDGNILYISRYSHIMQYQIQNNSFYKVYGWDTIYTESAGYEKMIVGPDDKIYIGNWAGTSKQMSVIDNPNIQGAGCNFCRKCLRAKSTYGYLSGPPNIPNYELGADLPCWPLGLSPGPSTEGEGSLMVHPNPASSIINIKTNSKEKRYLLSSVGQLLFSTFKNEIDITNYSKGFYYIKVGNYTKKVIIE